MYKDGMNDKDYKDLIKRIDKQNAEKRKQSRSIKEIVELLKEANKGKSQPSRVPRFTVRSEDSKRIQEERREESFKKYVDKELDKYNDLMELHNMFEDKEYKERAELILNNLKQESDGYKKRGEED